MGTPKKRTSKRKRDQRRAHWKITAPTVNRCPKCKEPVLSHTACANCGTYHGHQILEPEA
jgi:large subunit ribosomal protein L32